MGLDKTLLVDEVDEKFICGLCDQVLVNPVHAGCVHIFCKTCVARKLKSRVTKSVCPACNSSLSENAEDTTIEFKLNLLHLMIRCSNHCDTTFKLADLPDHLEICPLAPVKCEYQSKGCTKTVRRRDFKKHLESCDFRTVECEACGHVTIYRELFTHQSRARCLERKLKQQIIRERKVASQEINKHRQKLHRDITKLDQEQRKIFLDHSKMLSNRKYSKQSSLYSAMDDDTSDTSSNDCIFLTESIQQENDVCSENQDDNIHQQHYDVSNARTNSKTPHSSRCDYVVQICTQCDKRFREDNNTPLSCKWHIGPMVNVFGGTCFACGRPDYQPGCATGYHKV